MKKCCTCKIEKDANCFTKSVSRKDGLDARCILCKRQKYELSKDKHLKTCKRYYLTHKKEIQKRHIEYSNNRCKKDVHFRTLFNARVRVSSFLRGKESFSHQIGCSLNQLRIHLESKFQTGMSWENYGNKQGYWNIDHVFPLSVAYKEGSESFKKACHYTNLQPLWAVDNIKKSNHTKCDIE